MDYLEELNYVVVVDDAGNEQSDLLIVSDEELGDLVASLPLGYGVTDAAPLIGEPPEF